MPVDKSYLDTYRVKNLTDRTVTLGDLVNVSIPPNGIVDLLKYPRVTKEKIINPNIYNKRLNQVY